MVWLVVCSKVLKLYIFEGVMVVVFRLILMLVCGYFMWVMDCLMCFEICMVLVLLVFGRISENLLLL